MTPPDDVKKRTPGDYIFGKVIGEGSFSTVYLAKDVNTSKEYAIKVLEKAHILREKKKEYVMREKDVLRLLGSSCRYFVHMYSTFQDTERLYFVLTYAKKGELLAHINKHGSFNFECTRYYAAELVLALEFLHTKGIIHRDLKPENILFDETYHIVITDFGSAKIVDETEKLETNTEKLDEEQRPRRRKSFVGTAQFVSPEMLKNTQSFYSSDLWALGCIVYQMQCGKMPFVAGSEYLIFQKILKLEYEFPDGFHDVVKDLIEKLLLLDPEQRLGAGDVERYVSIRQHHFFDAVNWDNLGEPPSMSESQRRSISSVNDNVIPDHLEPGLDEEKVSKLLLDIITASATPSTPTRKKSEPSRKITDITSDEIRERLTVQENSNVYHQFVEGNLILKQGLLDKRKGLFPRRRMFLLTLGPRLFYVDPIAQVLKGEVPWSDDVRAEAKNFKSFIIHTPNRKYYLEDPAGYALEWVKAIDQLKEFYYPPNDKE